VKISKNRAFCLALILALCAPTASHAADCHDLFKDQSLLELDKNLSTSFEKLNRDFLDAFGRTSGYGSFQKFSESIHAMKKSEVQDLLKALDNEEFDVVMARPESTRESLLEKHRFTNIHESNRSMGDIGRPEKGETVVDAKMRRLSMESSYLGMDVDAYSRLPNSQKVKYGAMRKLKGMDRSINKQLLAYGSDIWVLKKNRIKSRTTFVLGDSLDRALFNPKFKPGTLGNDRSYWDQFFIPYQYRTAIVPETIASYKAGGEIAVMRAPLVEGYRKLFIKNGYNEFLPYRRSHYPHPFSNEEDVFNNGASYIEAQIFGDLDLADVEAFEFRNTPPSGEFLKLLKKSDITIIDQRGETPQIFTGNSSK
jgi:hypothetical protein